MFSAYVADVKLIKTSKKFLANDPKIVLKF